jgi:hypothetical protein
MQGSLSQDQIDRMNSYHLFIGKEFRKYAERNSIIRIVKRRNNHHGITDIEIGVARWKSLPVEIQG